MNNVSKTDCRVSHTSTSCSQDWGLIANSFGTTALCDGECSVVSQSHTSTIRKTPDAQSDGVNFNLFFPDNSIKKYTFAFIQLILFIFVSGIKNKKTPEK